MKRALKHITIIIVAVFSLLQCSPLNSMVFVDNKLLSILDDDFFWNIEITGSDNKHEEFSLRFDYELFINDRFVEQFYSYSAQQMNEVLEKFFFQTTITDRVELILLNHNFLVLNIATNGNQYIEQNNEIPLIFSGNQKKSYVIKILPARETNFIYVETSGGISNIRSLNDHIDSIAGGDNEFIIYYNGPAGAMVINDTDNLSALYNVLFTSITQPPFPGDELRKVKQVLATNLPENLQNVNLNLSFYLSEISFNRLFQRFVDPLISEISSGMGVRISSVTIYTDFNVSGRNPGYNYKNIKK